MASSPFLELRARVEALEARVKALESAQNLPLMAANLSALLIKECGLHSPGSSAHDLLQPSVEVMAQIVYENAMLATAPEHAKPHWPSWNDLPNSDARIHSLNTAEIILARYGRPAIEPAPGEVAELVRRLRDWHSIPLLEERERAATLLQQLSTITTEDLKND
jgi:hypothetical protein